MHPSAPRRAGTLLASAVALAATARLARSRTVTAAEDRSFRASNDLPDTLHTPLAAAMQFGSLGGALALGGVVALAGARRDGTAVAAAATASWALAKVVKSRVGRGRPDAHLDDVRVRGNPQRGLGFPSGHAAVAVTAAMVAGHHAGPMARVSLLGAAGVTSIARMYVGAHLPLDIVGGIALGLATGNATLIVLDAGR